MLCHEWAAVGPSLEAAAQAISGRTTRAKTDLHVSQSHARIERLREGLAQIDLAQIEKTLPPSVDVIGCAEHRKLASEIRARVGNIRS